MPIDFLGLRKIGWVQVEPTKKHKKSLNEMVGPTNVMVSGDTLQVNDYDKYNWTIFNPDAKIVRHNEVFPREREKAFMLGAEIVNNPWE